MVSSVEERAEKMSAELRELMDWEEREEEKIISRLKAEGRKLGLDGCPEAFAPTLREYKRRWAEIFEKYKDVPPGTKLNLW